MFDVYPGHRITCAFTVAYRASERAYCCALYTANNFTDRSEAGLRIDLERSTSGLAEDKAQTNVRPTYRDEVFPQRTAFVDTHKCAIRMIRNCVVENTALSEIVLSESQRLTACNEDVGNEEISKDKASSFAEYLLLLRMRMRAESVGGRI